MGFLFFQPKVFNGLDWIMINMFLGKMFLRGIFPVKHDSIGIL